MKKVVILILIAVIGLGLYFFYQDDPVLDEEVDVEEQVIGVGIELIAEGFTSPVGFVSANDGTGRMFLIDQIGLIKIIDEDGEVLEDNFLDVREKMVELREGFDERGLLGLAFHPEFTSNGRFFVHYSAPLREGAPEGWDHTGVIAEFRVSEDNPNVANIDSEKIIIQIDQPQFNHNGGHLAFGPDGYLYIPLGDGGGANDVGLGHPEIGNGQDTSNSLGSILRIDIDGEGTYSIPQDNPFVGSEDGLDEIFAYGFRNPYHISFDRGGSNELFVADVGQDLWEEVNIVTRGGNYGWNIREGMHCFDPETPADSPSDCPTVGAKGEGLINPILQYRNARHDGIGIAIVGGYVYRGQLIRGLIGQYVFADWSRAFGAGDGSLFTARKENDRWEFNELEILNGVNGRLGLFVKGVGGRC
ncbi:MAG: Quinoprotein glucose dehydrogenase B [candidate division WS2 bacterium]|uniref:Quinoprotein glucose dehydrogenase B n=1 Tax=Psychracetigena formicireducens TaxID=2986056 RepID=A0A9E2BIW0_PSYF1|nr:Quinoprotein glucose dehydrogenase B [Candidatus Psychracetigena formicireducens]